MKKLFLVCVVLLLTSFCLADGYVVGWPVASAVDPCETADGSTIFCVDPGVDGGTGDGSSAINAYSSLNSALTGEATDITGTSGGYTFICMSSDGTDDTTAVTTTGWTTDSDSYVNITQGDFPTDGNFDGAKYNLKITDGSAITVSVDYLKIDKLQIDLTVTTTGNAININSVLNGSTATDLEKLIIKAACSGTGSGQGIYSTDGGAVIIVKNSLIYGFRSGTDGGFRGIYPISAVSTAIYNSTIADNYYGIYIGSGSATSTNNAVFNNNDDYFGTITINYDANDDGDGTTGIQDLNENASNEWTNAFTDYSSGDYTVKDTSSLLYNNGDDLSGTVDYDIEGESRPKATSYDIGIDEL